MTDLEKLANGQLAIQDFCKKYNFTEIETIFRNFDAPNHSLFLNQILTQLCREETPLHIFKLFLTLKNIDLNAKMPSGETVIILPIVQKNLSFVDLLLTTAKARGVDIVNVYCLGFPDHKFTPLMMSIQIKERKIFQRLLQEDIDPYAVNQNNKTVWEQLEKCKEIPYELQQAKLASLQQYTKAYMAKLMKPAESKSELNNPVQRLTEQVQTLQTEVAELKKQMTNLTQNQPSVSQSLLAWLPNPNSQKPATILNENNAARATR